MATKHFALFDQEGYLVTRYVSGIHADIPPDAVEISKEDFDRSIAGGAAAWRLVDGALVEYPPRPLADNGAPRTKDSLQRAATVRRWGVMTGGLMLPGGIGVGTSVDDQNRITSVVANAALAGLSDSDEVDFKAASGWVRLSIGQIKGIAGAIGRHVQACYAAERQHHDAIALLDPADFDGYDLEAYWPSTDLTQP